MAANITSAGAVSIDLRVGDTSQYFKELDQIGKETGRIMSSSFKTVKIPSSIVDLSGVEKKLNNVAGAVDNLSDNVVKMLSEGFANGATKGTQAAVKAVNQVKLPTLKGSLNEEELKTLSANLTAQLDIARAKLLDLGEASEQADAKLESLAEEWRNMNGGSMKGFDASSLNQDIDNARSAFLNQEQVVSQLETKIRLVNEEISRLGANASNTMPVQQVEELRYSFNHLGERLSLTADELKRMAAEGQISTARLNAGLKHLGYPVEETKDKTDGLKDAFKHLGKIAVSSLGASALGAERLKSSMGGVGNLIRRTARTGLMLMGIRSAYMLIRQAVQASMESFRVMAGQNQGFANTMDSLARSADNLKGSFAAMAAPLIEVLAPALKWIIDLATRAFNAIAMFFGALAGKKSIQIATGSTAGFSNGLSSVGKKAKGATKEVEKYKRSLAGFDELEILDTSDKSNSGGGSPDIGGGGGGSSPTQQFTTVDIDTSAFKPLLDWLDKLKAAAEPTIQAFKRLVDSLEPLKTFVARGLQDFYNNFLKPMGLWALSSAFPRFLDGLTYMVQNINWGKLNDSLAEFWKALSKFSIKIGEGLLWFYENVLVPLGTWTMNEIVPRFIDILTASLDLFGSVIDAVAPAFEWLWDSLLSPIAEWTGGIITSVLDGIISALRGISDWINENASLIENFVLIIGSFAAAWGLVNGAIAIWNGLVAIWKGTATVATVATKLFGGAMAFLTSPVTIAIAIIGGLIAVGVLLWKNWDKVGKYVIAIWEFIKTKAVEIWTSVSNFFKAIWEAIKVVTLAVWNAIKGAVTAVWKGMFEGVKLYFNALFNHIKNIWGNIKGIFEGIIKFITGVFTGNWRKAWEGVSQIFRNIANGLVGIFKAPLNFIIDAINIFIRGLNKIKIPDWVPLVGGKGINIPQIPRLARGGIIDQPTVAMVGEAGKEAVMPLERNTGWIDQLAEKIASKNGGSNSGEGREINITQPIYIGTDNLVGVIESVIDREGRLRNNPVF